MRGYNNVTLMNNANESYCILDDNGKLTLTLRLHFARLPVVR